MAWTLQFDKKVLKDLSRVHFSEQRRIRDFLTSILDNPRKTGGTLKGPWAAFWRYRVGDYRIICELKDAELIVLMVKIGHRGEVY